MLIYIIYPSIFLQNFENSKLMIHIEISCYKDFITLTVQK
jgi:hypothetical protein